MNSQERKPVFVISPLNRSGTNYVTRAIASSGSYQIPKDIGEDYFCCYSDTLKSYISNTVRHWGKDYRKPDHPIVDKLMAGFGDVLLNECYSRVNNNQTPIMKCPRPYNINNVFQLFPNCKVIICTRDGPDTVESFFRSFKGHSFRQVVELWAKGMREICTFVSKNRNHNARILCVTYESLITPAEDTLQELREFCSLSEAELNQDSFTKLPSFGSSELAKKGSQVHWQPITKPSNFSPVGRADNWSTYKKLLYRRYTKGLNLESVK